MVVGGLKATTRCQKYSKHNVMTVASRRNDTCDVNLMYRLTFNVQMKLCVLHWTCVVHVVFRCKRLHTHSFRKMTAMT